MKQLWVSHLALGLSGGLPVLARLRVKIFLISNQFNSSPWQPSRLCGLPHRVCGEAGAWCEMGVHYGFLVVIHQIWIQGA